MKKLLLCLSVASGCFSINTPNINIFKSIPKLKELTNLYWANKASEAIKAHNPISSTCTIKPETINSVATDDIPEELYHLFKYDTYKEETSEYLKNLSSPNLARYVKPDLNHASKKHLKVAPNQNFICFEQEFRKKYSEILIPRIDISYKETVLPMGALVFSHYIYKFCIKRDANLFYAPNLLTMFSNELQWAFLHEVGHFSKEQYNLQRKSFGFNSNNSSFNEMLQRRDIFIQSKGNTLPKLSSTAISYCDIGNTDERLADNFANQTAKDKETLIGGIENFKKLKRNNSMVYKQLNLDSNISEQEFSNILDPVHPPIDERIGNIKAALKMRFNTEYKD